jgi:hypothetical protein
VRVGSVMGEGGSAKTAGSFFYLLEVCLIVNRKNRALNKSAVMGIERDGMRFVLVG